MTKRGTKRQGQPTPVAPIQGALTGDTDDPDNIALQMLLTRMEEMDKKRELEAQILTATLAEQVSTLQQELREEKARTQAAIDELHKKMVEVMESRPQDPKVTKAMLAAAKEDAKKEMARRRKEFAKYLETQTKGTIISLEKEPKKLLINGFEQIVMPGENKDVPAPFIEMWETQQGMRVWAEEVSKAFESHDSMKDANQYNAARGASPMWSEQTGIIR